MICAHEHTHTGTSNEHTFELFSKHPQLRTSLYEDHLSTEATFPGLLGGLYGQCHHIYYVRMYIHSHISIHTL